MLKNMHDALQHSSQFQQELRTQLHSDAPDLQMVCACCLECIKGCPDWIRVLEQLLNRNLQVACVIIQQGISLKLGTNLGRIRRAYALITRKL